MKSGTNTLKKHNKQNKTKQNKTKQNKTKQKNGGNPIFFQTHLWIFRLISQNQMIKQKVHNVFNFK